MARKKEFKEEEVIEKAMLLFWQFGYENTSMKMLEKQMGINKFSIYASFESKEGVFKRCLENYKLKMKTTLDRFKNGSNGVEDIKQFFYDSVTIDDNSPNSFGCLVTNTYNEFIHQENEIINNEMQLFMAQLKDLFAQKLAISFENDSENIKKQANYLLLAKHGLAAATRVNSKEEINDYIEMVFQKL